MTTRALNIGLAVKAGLVRTAQQGNKKKYTSVRNRPSNYVTGHKKENYDATLLTKLWS